MAIAAADVRTGRTRSRWSWATIALMVGIAAGASTTVILRDESAVDRPGQGTLLPVQTPQVTDLPMDQAIDTLVDAGFRVVAVGHGRIKLQELGARGHTLRIQGRHGSRLRYCTARLPDCVPIPSR